MTRVLEPSGMSVDNLVHGDYEHARRKASWRQIISRLTGRRNELLRFDEVRLRLRAQGRHAVGTRACRSRRHHR